MIYQITIGRHQFSVYHQRRPGRPRKTPFFSLKNFLVFLRYVATDNRFHGQPVSRVFRRVFEIKQTKKILGFNLMAATLLTGVINPLNTANTNIKPELTEISASVIQLTTETTVRQPLADYQISQYFSLFHPAIDLTAPIKTPVYPIMKGRVVEVVKERIGYGNHLTVDHGAGLKSLYAHLNKILVSQDNEVGIDTVIGEVGTTGWTTGPHLHLEVSDHDRPFNPLTILK